LFAVFIPMVGWVGAIRVARPRSPWAHRRYEDKPKKLAKAQRREDRINATWRAWREAFFDLIAGKPHLPSATPVADAAADAQRVETDSGSSSEEHDSHARPA
jgi:lysyl-tRNA synthetase class 2